MSVIALIKRDHDEVVDLFDRLALLARDDRYNDQAARTAARLVAAARVHARAEERVLYEAIRCASPRLKAFSLAGPHQHEMLDITLDKLLVHRPGDEFRVILQVARDLFEMHARDEEEGEILPLLAEALTAEELAALAVDMIAEQARVRPHVLRLVGSPARAA